MNPDSANYAVLARLLNQAAGVVGCLRELNVYCPFDTPAELAGRIRELAERVRAREHAALRELIPIFAPTGTWDDAVGPEGMELANQIDELLHRLRWDAEATAESDRRP